MSKIQEIKMALSQVQDTTGHMVNTFKFKVLVSLVPALQEVVTCTPGRSWIEDRNGNREVCYVYLKINDDMVKAIQGVLPKGGRTLVDVEVAGNPGNQKTWKYSLARDLAFHLQTIGITKQSPRWDVEMSKAISEGTVGAGLEIKWDQKKKKFSSNLDGKTVRYHYNDQVVVD